MYALGLAVQNVNKLHILKLSNLQTYFEICWFINA